MRTRLVGAMLAAVVSMATGIGPGVLTSAQAGGGALSGQTCVETPRLPASTPAYVAERAMFGFHDEELLLCSAGFETPTHLSARMFVPAGCEHGGCPGVLVTHGFGFTKELTLPDMQNLAVRGLVVLSYDVRGHGGSGGQVGLMGREEIADEAHVLEWFHREVAPTKVGVYGISQGGAHAFMAAIFNCGPARAANIAADPDAGLDVDSAVPCDEGPGGRWVDAIVPFQGPTNLDFFDDGTCMVFLAQASVQSRFNPELTHAAASCSAGEMGVDLGPPAFDFGLRDYVARADRIDVPTYVVTSFHDRLVPPRNSTEMYEALRDRSDDGGDPYHGSDVRLTISNDGHGAVGGNFALLNDAFLWLEMQLKGTPEGFERSERFAFAQEWDGNRMAAEDDWPYWNGAVDLHLGAGGSLSEGPASEDGNATLTNTPVLASPPQAPFSDQVPTPDTTTLVPGTWLDWAWTPGALTEIAGEPHLRIWVSSPNPASAGRGQLHVSLQERTADGNLVEIAVARRGLTGLGTTPVPVDLRLSVSSHRVDPDSALVLRVTPSDVAVTQPTLGTDELRIHHGPATPSRLHLDLADATRPITPGPTGPAFPQEAPQAICAGLRLPCDQFPAMPGPPG